VASELISSRIQINSEEESGKAARDFSASTAPAYGLSIRTIRLSRLNNDLPGLESLLKHKSDGKETAASNPESSM
jgi:hypothetical protein